MITYIILAYLAVGLYLVINGMFRGLHIEFLRAGPVTLLKKDGTSEYRENYRDYAEFFGSVLLVWLGWLPLLGLRIYLWNQGRRAAKEFERTNQRKEMGL